MIALIKQLHEEFIQTHADVHTTFVESHEREHNLRLTATNKALDLAATNLTTEIQRVREFYDALLVERDRRYEERFEAAEAALRTAFQAREDALAAALDSQERAVSAAFRAQQDAISKAETSIEKRADATYVTLTELSKQLAARMSREEADQRFLAFTAITDDLRDRVKGLEAMKAGGREAFSNLQMVLGLIATLIVLGGFVFAVRAG